MDETCATCVYERGKKCEVLKEKISHNCFAWADESEAKRRKEAIKDYYDTLPENELPKKEVEKRNSAIKANREKRGGKLAKELLEERFDELYNQGLNDAEIAKILYTLPNIVCLYRNSKGLPPNRKKKSRPAGTGKAR